MQKAQTMLQKGSVYNVAATKEAKKNQKFEVKAFRHLFGTGFKGLLGRPFFLSFFSIETILNWKWTASKVFLSSSPRLIFNGSFAVTQETLNFVRLKGLYINDVTLDNFVEKWELEP